ncbi:MAG: protein kinase, partial [Thermoguttaceae bacterium]|nr:protein kinase [Thermoguttaceae bacterium]
MSESQNFEESILTLLPPEDVNYDPKQFEDLHDGYLFGKFKNYRLKKKLGEGGMGQTWLAEELVENEVSRRVVLKILTRELRGNEDALKEVRRVFDLTKNLNHSSICPLLGRYVDPNFGDFLVMKYADGGTLADWYNAQPGHENGLPLETLLPIFRPLAEALDLAHRNGILHRDVKPQNIMFMGRDKTPVLIDFGIAARIRPENVTSNTQSFSRTDTMASSTSGTPRYMAPEQMEGKSQNSRTDQYALAMTLYEMLTGTLPFSGGVVSIVLQKSRFNPQSPQFAPHVNAALARALSFEPKDRFESCGEFVNALSAVSSSVPSFSSKGTAGQTAETLVPDVDTMAERLAHARLRKEQNGGRPPLFNRRNFLLGGLGATAAALGVWRMTQDTEEPLPAPESPLPAPEEPLPAPESPLNNYSPAPLDPSENGILGTFPFGTAAGERKVWQVDGIYYAFRWCPPGTFLMGSPEDEPGRFDGETQHSVTLTRGFWMLETEVTEEMWHHVMSAGVATQA